MGWFKGVNGVAESISGSFPIEITIARAGYETSQVGVSDQEKLLSSEAVRWLWYNQPSVYWSLVWLAAQQKWRDLYRSNV